MEKSLLGLETVFEIINDEEVDDVWFLVVIAVVHVVVVVIPVVDKRNIPLKLKSGY